MADEPPEADEPPGDGRIEEGSDGSGDRPDGPRDGPQAERSEPEEPLSDLADRIRRRRSGDDGRGGPTDGDEGDGGGAGRSFREEPFDPTASDRLWQSIDEASPLSAVEVGEAAAADVEHVVPKRSYCESCEHFGEPPVARCEHPGTTIVEFADAEQVRVRNCPIVAERRATGEAPETGPGRGLHPDSFGRQ